MIAVGVVAALAAEARTLGPATRRGPRLAALADGSLLCVSGMGDAAARTAAAALLEAGVLGLISWGVAGGLDPALTPGTLLLPGRVIGAGGASLPTDAAWRTRVAAAARAARVPLNEGPLFSSAQAIGSVAAKAAAFAATQAVAVDMESYAIAEVARTRGVPFIIVRAVVDAATDALPASLLAAVTPGAPLRLKHLVGELARTPRELPSLARLALRFRAARRALRSAAHSGALVAPPAP